MTSERQGPTLRRLVVFIIRGRAKNKEKEERKALFPDVHTPRKRLVGTQIRWQSVSQENLSPEPSHTGTLISHFQPPELRENAFLLRFKSPSLWYLLF